MEAIEAKSDRRQKALLLHIEGDKIEKIYEAQRDTATAHNDEKYAVIFKLLTDHFSPQKYTSVPIMMFRQASQLQSEEKDAFLVRLNSLYTPF